MYWNCCSSQACGIRQKQRISRNLSSGEQLRQDSIQEAAQMPARVSTLASMIVVGSRLPADLAWCAALQETASQVALFMFLWHASHAMATSSKERAHHQRFIMIELASASNWQSCPHRMLWQSAKRNHGRKRFYSVSVVSFFVREKVCPQTAPRRLRQQQKLEEEEEEEEEAEVLLCILPRCGEDLIHFCVRYLTFTHFPWLSHMSYGQKLMHIVPFVLCAAPDLIPDPHCNRRCLGRSRADNCQRTAWGIRLADIMDVARICAPILVPVQSGSGYRNATLPVGNISWELFSVALRHASRCSLLAPKSCPALLPGPGSFRQERPMVPMVIKSRQHQPEESQLRPQELRTMTCPS